MKKKIVTCSLVVALLVIGVIGASLAYFTDQDAKENVFTVGNVDIELNEPSWEIPASVAPGIEYAKDPVVKNVGTNDAYIRVDVKVSDWAAFKAAAAAHQITDLSTIFAGHDAAKWTRAAIIEDATADTATYQYYYNTAIAKGASTDALFTSVTVPAAFTSTEMAAIAGNDGKFTIDVTAHAIQADGFNSVQDAFANYEN